MNYSPAVLRNMGEWVNHQNNILEKEIIEYKAREMQKEIDFEIMSGFLIETGWKKVVLRPMTHEHGDAIDQWTAASVKGNFKTMGLVWIFEDPKEATLFSLKWS